MVRIQATPEELWELYAVLDIRNKLENGQAYIQPYRTGNQQPNGDFPIGTRGQMVEIRLAINGHLLCRAHRYILGNREITGPDPKYFRIDNLRMGETPKSR